MSELLALARRPYSADDMVALAAAGFTDCDLDPQALDGDPAALDMVRAVRHGFPDDHAPLSPQADRLDRTAIRYVIDGPAPDLAALDHLHTLGVRGIRHRLADDAATLAAQLETIGRDADAIAPLGWHIELVPGRDLSTLLRHEWELTTLPVVLCLSGLPAHVARFEADDEVLGFVLDLLHMGRTYVALGGLETGERLRRFTNAALAVRSDRLLWGSGSAAPALSAGDRHGRIARSLAVLLRMIPDEDDRAAVLVQNPARLYGFEG
ncbi:MAG: hypothetical protein P4M07_07970 [Xanthobacteraceae bacterium]|nr:hypothetical protein [Xanthobacteraceae bacterium]